MTLGTMIPTLITLPYVNYQSGSHERSTVRVPQEAETSYN